MALRERTKKSRRGGTPAARRNRFVGLQPLTEERRSPSSALVDVTSSPIFLPRAPDRNPRTECACQPVAFMSSFRVAPPERFSRSRTLAVLLPWRAPVAFLGDWADLAPLLAFFAGLACLPDVALDGATWTLCAADRGSLAGFGCSAGAPASVLTVFAGMPFIVRSPLAVITAITWITRVDRKSVV